MARWTGWALMALGAVVAVVGIVGAVVLGPDSRFTTGPHPVDTSGTVVVTTPGVITHRGVQVDVLAEVPVNKPVFVGLGNAVDVQDLVSRTERLEVTSFSTPWEVEMRQVDGQPGLPGAPTALDWWITDSAGLGGASISTTLPDETVSLAVLAVGSTNLSGLQVSLAYGVRGGFASSLALVLLGTGGVLGGNALRRGQRLFVEEVEDLEEIEYVEEVVYVVVGEDGEEHELSAEEVAELEAAGWDPAEGWLPDELPGPAEESPLEPPVTAQVRPVDPPVIPPDAPVRRPAIANVATAGDIARDPRADHDLPSDAPERLADATEPERAPEPDEAEQVADDQLEDGDAVEPPATAPDAPLPVQEKVVYVFVDEDGVEHEVPEDELDAFEIVEEEDQT